MVTDELKAMQSNPNMNMADQNYKNRLFQPSINNNPVNNNNNPQLINKNRPIPTLQHPQQQQQQQPHQQSSNNFLNNKVPNNNHPIRNSFENTQQPQASLKKMK